ncbi:hypothetical protein [Actinomyces minihominis]|uniref:hypothetical protein n=1 Tax=Actinomyces minihominis TaxID=2002838 RepID=UPI000C0813CA|nr:hypothetical protein [Actinomyces minihominis]
MSAKTKDKTSEPVDAAERSASITVGGNGYELLLTTRATREIAGRFGGLENLGDTLMAAENFEQSLSDLIWLITLLANQSILVHNLTHPDDQQTLLTEEAVELLTVPGDLVDYKDAIAECLTRGTKRNIVSGADPKAPATQE